MFEAFRRAPFSRWSVRRSATAPQEHAAPWSQAETSRDALAVVPAAQQGALVLACLNGHTLSGPVFAGLTTAARQIEVLRVSIPPNEQTAVNDLNPADLLHAHDAHEQTGSMTSG